MNTHHLRKISNKVEMHRFRLLLIAALLVLILPAFSEKGILYQVIFVFTMSFLFIQSLIVSTGKKAKLAWLRYVFVVVLIILIMLDPIGYDIKVVDYTRLILIALFFVFIAAYLIKFMRNSERVNIDVIYTAIIVYLLIGIIAASISYLLYLIYPGAYNFPDNIVIANYTTFTYYSFVTMTTLGYGDITPAIPQTQTLGYLIAITGQMYVAIIIAILVGKLISNPEKA